MSEQLEMVKICKVIEEAESVRTFIFHHKIDFAPGQFIMVWIPRVDEKPFTVSYHTEDEFGITVFRLGEFTKRLYPMNVGDRIGIRGPYGNGFKPGSKACAIGGGVGMAAIVTLAAELDDLVIVQGAKTSASLLYQKRFPNMVICTDDGTEGRKGFPTDYLAELQNKHQFEKIYTCGPEIMMKKVLDFCVSRGVQCEASLERYMKCGIGICGQCVCDGFRVCTDGPVFSGEALSKIDDFGRCSLLKSGKKVHV